MLPPQQIPPQGDGDAPLGQYVNRFEPPISPLDVAMADDPAAAGAEVIFSMARPLEGLSTRTGPPVPGGRDPSQNARTHGCTAKTIDASEMGRFREIQGNIYTEHRPESDDEAAAADRMATARFMREKCDRAIQVSAINAIDKHKAERRKPLEAEIVRLETSLRIWEHAQNRKFDFGKGFGDAYPILLKDLDPASSVKNLKEPIAREFAFFHSLALANPRLMELYRKFAKVREPDRNDPEFRELLRGQESLDEDERHLMGWVRKHVMNVRNLLEKAQRDLIRVDTSPVDKDVLLLLSDDFRKLQRYQREYESSYYRNLKGFEAIRRHLMTSFERELQDVQRKYSVMYKVGPLGIHLPKELGSLCPYDQIEAMIRIMHREQRYYDRNDRNAARETAARAKPFENQGITPATWNLVDSADGIHKRVIGGETALRPAPGAPKPPDEAEPPR